MVMTWPRVNALPAAGDWRVTVPAGRSLWAACTSLMLTPLAAVHCSATAFCCPTKSGIGGPELTVSITGFGWGQDTPAFGWVAMTMPAPMVADGAIVTFP